MADTANFIVNLKDKVSRPARKMRNSLDSVGDSFQRQDAKAMGLGGAIKRLAGAYVVLRGAQAAAAGGLAVLTSAMNSDKMIFALDRLTHHGRESFDEIGFAAADLGLDIDKTRKSYANFLKLQFPEAEAKKMIALGADMQALGNSADDIQGIFRALGQIRSKGRVQAEEMLQLAERGVSQALIMEAVARNRGIADPGGQAAKVEVQKLQQAGELSADEFFVAFEEAINKKLGQAEVGQSAREFTQKTITGRLNRAAQQTKLTFETLARVAGEGFNRGLSGAEKAIASFMGSGDGIRMMSRLTKGFQAFGDWLGHALPLMAEFGTALVAGLGDGFTAVSNALGDTGSSGEDWATFLRDNLVPTVRFAGEVVGGMTAGLIFMSKMVGAAVTAVGLGVEGWRLLFSEIIPDAWQWGSDIISGLINGMSDGIGRLWDAAKRMGDAVKSGIDKALHFGSPSKVMRQYGRWTGEGFEGGLGETMPDVGQSLPSRTTAASNAATLGRKTSGSTVSVGDTTIHVQGSENPEQTAQAVLRAFERNLGSVVGRMAGEAAA